LGFAAHHHHAETDKIRSIPAAMQNLRRNLAISPIFGGVAIRKLG
jgi:hypothetical protein